MALRSKRLIKKAPVKAVVEDIEEDIVDSVEETEEEVEVVPAKKTPLKKKAPAKKKVVVEEPEEDEEDFDEEFPEDDLDEESAEEEDFDDEEEEIEEVVAPKKAPVKKKAAPKKKAVAVEEDEETEEEEAPRSGGLFGSRKKVNTNDVPADGGVLPRPALIRLIAQETNTSMADAERGLKLLEDIMTTKVLPNWSVNLFGARFKRSVRPAQVYYGAKSPLGKPLPYDTHVSEHIEVRCKMEFGRETKRVPIKKK